MIKFDTSSFVVLFLFDLVDILIRKIIYCSTLSINSKNNFIYIDRKLCFTHLNHACFLYDEKNKNRHKNYLYILASHKNSYQ